MSVPNPQNIKYSNIYRMVQEYQRQLWEWSERTGLFPCGEMSQSVLNYKGILEEEWASGEAGLRLLEQGKILSDIEDQFSEEALAMIRSKANLSQVPTMVKKIILSYKLGEATQEQLEFLKTVEEPISINLGMEIYEVGVDHKYELGWLELATNLWWNCGEKTYMALRWNNSRPVGGLDIREVINMMDHDGKTYYLRMGGGLMKPTQFMEFHDVFEEIEDLYRLWNGCPQLVTNWTIPVTIRKVRRTSIPSEWLFAPYHLVAERSENPEDLKAFITCGKAEGRFVIGMSRRKLVITD